MSTINKLTVIQSLQMIEDLLKDVIASAICMEHNIRRNKEAFDDSMSLRQIKEDGKTIYYLLDRVTTINDQTTFTDALSISPDFVARVFNYEAMLSKMGESEAGSAKPSV